MQSLNLTAAFVVSQFLLLAIVFSGITLLKVGESRFNRHSYHARPATRRFPLLFGGFALLTLGALIFSQDVLLNSKPVFGDLELPGLSKSNAFLAVFLIDLVGASALIAMTGGSKNSPFSAILFVLPTLSIFLRESPDRFLSYTFLAAVLFLLVQTDFAWEDIEDNPYHRRAFSFVTLGCLALTTMVGYATRPV